MEKQARSKNGHSETEAETLQKIAEAKLHDILIFIFIFHFTLFEFLNMQPF